MDDSRPGAPSAVDGEARFRAIFESIDEGYCLCEVVVDAAGRPVDYRFLEVNRHFEGMTGLVDAVGRTALELVPDLERHWVETYGRVALEGEPLRFEQGSDVMQRWFDVYAMPVAPHGRFALVFKDVTTRRLAELAQIERAAEQERARRRAELLAELVGDLDAGSSTEDRLRRLVQRLVPEVGDLAAVEAPAGSGTWIRSSPEGELPPTGRLGLQASIDLGTEARGVLRVGLTDPERVSYAAADESFIVRVAERASAAIIRGQLRDDEHEAVVRLQRALLPARVLEHPQLEISARYVAAGRLLEVGGDWYDAVELADGRIVLSVGDVVGHGVDAAAAMGRTRAALTANAYLCDDPAAVLDGVDYFIAQDPDPQFTTAACVYLGLDTGAVSYSSAGHLPGLIVTPSGETAWLDRALTPPMFGWPWPNRPSASEVLPVDGTLILFSDGLVERRGLPLDQTLETLRGAARSQPGVGASELCDILMQTMAVGDTPNDDVVLLCVTRRAAG